VDLIPIKNLYYLLCYSWDQLDEGEIVDASALDSTELADLFAHVLIGGVTHLMRRGLEQGYEQLSNEIQGIRGRVNLLRSGRRMLLLHGRAACDYDEMSVDTIPNRILKSTIKSLAGRREVDRSFKSDLGKLYRMLRGITDVPLTSNLFQSVQFHSNNRYYKFLLSVCRLVCESVLVGEEAGSETFRDFRRDKDAMARLFQSFVLNFCRKERPHLRPHAEDIHWDAKSDSDPTLSLIPKMTTDISLTSKNEKLIVDTKYYQHALSEHWGKSSIKSANLYQLFAYLVNYAATAEERVSGMLLYPKVDRHLRETYQIQGFEIRVCTVDLSSDWKEIRKELLELVDLWGDRPVAPSPRSVHCV
jgi:5-methylcytosine-specific restriction enzyme subunit McrC